ncbi:MAG: hypothetical protein RBR02_06350 [Desulfuromonadaceae bacterium]|nr:hypothetical protein [Desulfuromonadaceae bacterium]
MPFMKCKLPNGKQGWKWGNSGKCYATKGQADKQRRAIQVNKRDKR